MSFLTLMALATALAMDAFAISITSGMQLRCISLAQTARMALAFGFFQFAMPVAGWLLGFSLQRHIEAYDHWVAFILLTFVGGKMLKDAWGNRGHDVKSECTVCPDPTKGISLLVLAVATSIDALAVGFSMALLGQEVLFPALVIGAVCFAFTAIGMHLGRVLCSVAGGLGHRANAAGGVVLIAIGCNILRDHGVFG